MKFKRQLPLVVRLSVILLAGLSLTSCSMNKVAERQIEQTNVLCRLCITGESGDYRKLLFDTVVDHYKDKCRIDVISLSKVGEIEPEKYDALLIIDQALAWTMFNMKTKYLLKKAGEKGRKNIVLYMTSGDQDWAPGFKDVDAITGASNVDNLQAEAERIITRLDKILAKP